MGIQAKERQDELFDLRHDRRRLLVALALALTGDPPDVKAALITLTEMASDPAMAKVVLSVLETRPDKFATMMPDVFEIARRNSSPRPEISRRETQLALS